MRLKLTLAYDGFDYSGWQLQLGQDSIQGRLEAALAQIFGSRIRVDGSSRTDAGTHAIGQVAAFSIPRRMPIVELARALNALTPADIVIRDLAETSENFDPRRHATARVYEYRILHRIWPSPFELRYAWFLRELLALEAMQAAAALFVGEHDFSAFRTMGSQETTTRRRIYSSGWRLEADHLIYRVEATAFLRHMVRTMIAAMVEIGRGRLHPAFVGDLLSRGDRAEAPAPAPACGLYLIEVRYDDSVFADGTGTF